MSQLPDSPVLDAVREARRAGVVAVLGGDGTVGLACPGALRVSGPDAASFLHSQVTNEVEKLEVGQGNRNARVRRTGHLFASFSLHRIEEGYLLVLARDGVAALADELEAFHFVEDLTITDVSDDWQWVAVQGPLAETMLGQADEGAVRADGGDLVIRRSLGGDPGYLVLCRDPAPWVTKATEAGLTKLDGPTFSDVLEVLRIEAGEVRVDVDMPAKKRLLPETGLEQKAVSYTKGCYIGQEVIARVRTYGSVPWALRGLLLHGEPAAALAALPAPGEELRLQGGGRVGYAASRTLSPTAEAAVAFAFLDRDHRTPGSELTFEGGVTATVAVLPFYAAADTAARVQQLYDRAIRVFAEGRHDEALELLEQCLQIDASFGDAYEAIGVMLGRAGRFHEAIDFFKRLEEVVPDEPLVNTNLSVYYMKLGDKTTAELQAGTAMEKELRRGRPEDGRSVADVAKEAEQKRLKDARRKRDMFGMVLEIDADDPIALFGIGNAYATLGEHAKAEEHFRRACEVDKNNSAVWLARGKALEALERTAEAIDIYQQGMEVASRRGDLMPLKEMEHRVLLLRATGG